MDSMDDGAGQIRDLSLMDDLGAGRLEVRFEVPRLRGFGDLLGRSFGGLRDNFRIILWVTLVLVIPFDVVVSFCDAFSEGEDGLAGISKVASLIQNFTIALATPAVIYAMFIRMRDGREVGLSEALSWGAKVFPRSLGYQIVSGLIVLLGFLLLIIPGLIFSVWYALVGVVVVVEGKNHPGVLARSKSLTAGRRWWIFGFYLLLVGAFLVLALVVGVADAVVWSAATEIWSIHGVVSFVIWLVFSLMIDVLMWLFSVMALAVYMDGVGTHLMECPGCGYNLTGNTSGACTECGQGIPDDVQQMIAGVWAPVNEPWSS